MRQDVAIIGDEKGVTMDTKLEGQRGEELLTCK